MSNGETGSKSHPRTAVIKQYATTVLPAVVVFLGGLSLVTSFQPDMIPIYLIVGTVLFLTMGEVERRVSAE